MFHLVRAFGIGLGSLDFERFVVQAVEQIPQRLDGILLLAVAKAGYTAAQLVKERFGVENRLALEEPHPPHKVADFVGQRAAWRCLRGVGGRGRGGRRIGQEEAAQKVIAHGRQVGDVLKH